MKTFILILLPVLIIELWHTKIDFTKKIETYVQSYAVYNNKEPYLPEINELIEKEGIRSSKVIDQVLLAGNRYRVLLDKNQEVVYQEYSSWLRAEHPIMYISNDTGYYGIDLSILADKKLEDLEEYINMNYLLPDKEFEIEIAGDIIEVKEDEQIEERIVPTFLKIDDIVLYDKGTSKDSETFVLDSYSSQKIFFSKYPYEEAKKYTYHNFIQEEKRYKEVFDRNINKEPFYQMDHQNIGYEIVNDDVYIIDISNFSDNEYGYVDYGQLVDISKMEGVVSLAKGDVLNEKRDIYIGSLIFAIISSFLISYMMTRRIKKIEKATQEIEKNNFDVKLKETPYDELGQLSRSINSMSSQLESNIHLLNEEIENVKQLETVRKEFVAQFTHEIKTPLSIINGYIELVSDTKDETKKEEYLVAIEKEVESVNQLVLAMLNISRLESGNTTLNLKELDLEEMVSEQIDGFIPLLNKKHLKVQFKGSPSIIVADESEMQLVIKNLLSNAIKHTPKFGSIYIIFKENSLSIENEGSHITDEQKDNIWNNYVSNERNGTGLGLAICKSILDLHAFKYEVTNTDKGVCFTIVFK